MWERLTGAWDRLSDLQRNLIIVALVLAGLGILGSYIFLGTDYSGFGGWLQGWR